MAIYMVNGKTAATAATIDHAIATVWNPHASRTMKVLECHVFKQAAGAADEPVIRRITARGTAGSTVTPGSINEATQLAAPVTGFLLDLAAFTGQPTIAAGNLYGAVIPATIGSGMVWVFATPIMVPAGAGVGLFTGIGLAFPVARVTFVVED